jgi:hypothetical protein
MTMLRSKHFNCFCVKRVLSIFLKRHLGHFLKSNYLEKGHLNDATTNEEWEKFSVARGKKSYDYLKGEEIMKK